jgi:signal transduction histidine kinase
MKENQRRFDRHPLLVVISACLILLVSAGGYWLYSEEAQVILDARFNELKAISDLKVSQIGNWRQERVSNARMNASGLICTLYNQWMETPENTSLKDAILKRMQTFKDMEFYDDLILTDTRGNVLISVNPAASALDGYAKQLIAQTVSTNEIVFGDLFRCTICNRVHIDILAPIREQDSRPTAVLILRSDPEKYLFPLIQSWPTPSRSSETVIGRKDGDTVVFLNTLRHQPESKVLTRHIPLAQVTNPMVQGILGHRGYFEGKDYREVDVISNLSPIPGSPWIMVAKVDSEEILAEVNNHRNYMVLFVCLLIALTIAIAAFFHHYHEHKQLEDFNHTLEMRIQEAVAELRRKDQILINQNRMAAMGEMIANIAHQWRQPLNALGLVLANIKDAYQFNTLDSSYLNQAMRDGTRLIQKMSSTINDFSNFFRPDKERVVFSARKQIQAAIQLVTSSYSSSNITLHFNASTDLNLQGFPNEYSQVLLNLLSNAKETILAHPSPDQPVSGNVEIQLTASGGQGIVSVKDTGGGIPEDVLDKIFDPYFSTKDSGTGIGLYMSKMIIEGNMNGSITARNIDGGAEFIVCSPLAPEKDNLNESHPA